MLQCNQRKCEQMLQMFPRKAPSAIWWRRKKENKTIKALQCALVMHHITLQMQFVQKKTEQNQKSIAACTINCWSNVTEKLIQCEQHIHTESEVSFGGYHECRLDCSHHCSIRNYGKNLKWRKNDLEERKSSNNRSSHFWLLTINCAPVFIIIIFNFKDRITICCCWRWLVGWWL